jgi:hypothetical protein
MKMKGIDGLTVTEIQNEVANGGKFVLYTYCISIVVLSFKRSSAIYFIRSGENAFVKGLPFTLISLVLGWWGIPWGIIYTIRCLANNFGGGKDVTAEIMKSVHRQTSGHVFDFENKEALAR